VGGPTLNAFVGGPTLNAFVGGPTLNAFVDWVHILWRMEKVYPHSTANGEGFKGSL
jgi:hypothetical protein